MLQENRVMLPIFKTLHIHSIEHISFFILLIIVEIKQIRLFPRNTLLMLLVDIKHIVSIVIEGQAKPH